MRLLSYGGVRLHLASVEHRRVCLRDYKQFDRVQTLLGGSLDFMRCADTFQLFNPELWQWNPEKNQTPKSYSFQLLCVVETETLQERKGLH